MAFNNEIMVASGGDEQHPGEPTIENIPGGGSQGGVTGVKGNAESTYRDGNVNITQDNIVDDTSTNNISDSDVFITKEGNTWYKKTFAKAWDYIKGKIGISEQGSNNKYLDEQGNFTDVLSLLHPVGTIIESTTCDTMAKVVAAYGGTTWKQHTGYILRGASSNVTSDDNSNTGTGFGGSDTETLTGAQSGLKAHGHGFTQPTVNGGATNTGWVSADHSHSGTTGAMDRSAAHNHAIGMHGDGGVVGGNAWNPIAGQSGETYSLGGPTNGGGHIYARNGTGAGYTDSTNIDHLHAFSTGGISANHYHSQVAHTHSVSGGAVTDASASNATSAHSTVQRYKNIYIWERTA